MAILQIITYALQCDGCKTVFCAPHGVPSPMDARGAAYGAGWRFPPLTGKNDDARAITSDVCPACLPEWTPQEKRPPQRRATDAQMREWARRQASEMGATDE